MEHLDAEQFYHDLWPLQPSLGLKAWVVVKFIHSSLISSPSFSNPFPSHTPLLLSPPHPESPPPTSYTSSHTPHLSPSSLSGSGWRGSLHPFSALWSRPFSLSCAPSSVSLPQCESYLDHSAGLGWMTPRIWVLMSWLRVDDGDVALKVAGQDGLG
jgi:hypothetical protein